MSGRRFRPDDAVYDDAVYHGAATKGTVAESRVL
jgi:hypothetical protein